MAALLRLHSSAAPSAFPVLNLISRTFASKKTQVAIVLKGKPRTSWQLFINDHKHRFKDENGRIKMIEASKSLSAEWKLMTEDQKKPFLTRQHAEHEEYNRTMQATIKKATPLERANEKARHRESRLVKLKDPNQPKRPINSFLCFFQEMRNTSDELKKVGSVKEQAARSGEMWRALPENEKKKYKDQADEAMKQYKGL